MSEKELKLTDLDYATGDHHLQMVKAALPYLDIGRQRNLSMFVKVEELLRTMEFFRDQRGRHDEDLCARCGTHFSAIHALSRPPLRKPSGAGDDRYDDPVLRDPEGAANAGVTPDQLLALLPPDVKNQFETLQMVIQSFAPGGSA